MPDTNDPLLVFGYGSLIFRPGFEHVASHRASATGWTRRFWQSSHDHRGTPQAPGRVVTLVPVPGERCEGLVWEVAPTLREETLEMLDRREQDGYERVAIAIDYADPGSAPDERVEVLTWIAREGNESWAGDAPVAEIAALIASREGPSGPNADYLAALDAALRGLRIEDAHVRILASRVEGLRS